MHWIDKAKKYLKKYWNIDNLKDKQFEVINELLLGNDVIGLLPTGYGKSMCYLIPPLVKRKTMIIISPLISLMEDQIDKLKKAGLKCSALHGNNNNKDTDKKEIINGDIKIVYISPEYLIRGNGLELLNDLVEANKLGFIAIDESHCISSWGHDFRPEYTKIKVIREMYPDIPILAVTATATKTVCSDIKKNLLLNDNTEIVRASFDRPNLYIGINVPEKNFYNSKKKYISFNKINILKHYISKYENDKVIIYTNTRDETEELSNMINNIKKGTSESYHAGFSKDKRESIQNKFIEGKINIIVSTVAFGMGIDQIVRCVIIFGCPSSIEEYYQQIGRGGRDGKQCETELFFDYGKYFGKTKMLEKEKNEYSKIKLNNLKNVYNFVHTKLCRRKYILKYFCDNDYNKIKNCGNCDNCNKNTVKLSKESPKQLTDEEKIDYYSKMLD